MRIGDENLENVEPFILDHFPVIPQQVHAYLEVFTGVYICRHDAVVGAVKEDLSEKLNGLSFGDVAIRLYQGSVVSFEEHVEVGRKISGHKILVPCQKLLKGKSGGLGHDYTENLCIDGLPDDAEI